MRYEIVVLLLFAIPAMAQEERPLLCSRPEEPIGCFVSAAHSARIRCDQVNLKLGLDIDVARLSGTRLPVERHLDADKCWRSAEPQLKTYLSTANAVAKPELAALLTDYYVGSVTYLREAVPKIDERDSVRRRRLEPLEQELRKLELRIDLLK